MEKLVTLRKKLHENKLDAYLVPLRDEWGCEYVPEYNNRLKRITGFTGSNGFAIIAKEKAAFFTDGRYTLQAKIEVSEDEFELHDMSDKGEIEWLTENLKTKSKVGYDPALFTISAIRKFEEKLAEKNIKLVELDKNLVDEIWTKRPQPTETKAFALDRKFCGVSTKDKIKEIVKKIKGDALLIFSSESVCWLMNLRANDLLNTPVLFSYAILNKKGEVYLYSNLKALQKIEDKIEGDVYLRETKEIFADLKMYSGKKVDVDANITPVKFKNILLKNKAEIIEIADPCLEGRSIKNETEIENWRKAHIRDGAALTKFLYWINNYKEELNEVTVAEKLEGFRKFGENFFGLSFDSIVGWKGNGAIVHYRATEETAATIKGDGILLLDSGAQYFDGTTDVTRTFVLGKATAEQRKNFTLVLKGHIAVAKQKFVKGTSGANLDVLARQFLWNEGLDYKHGTGHGVGYFLNVHEGPHGISKINTTPLKPGMVVSNEPGYYKEGEYGIRIESLVLVKEAEAGYYEFETLTKAPIDKKLIDKQLLTKDEIDWLDNYHDDVYKKLSPSLTSEEKEWLKEVTQKL